MPDHRGKCQHCGEHFTVYWRPSLPRPRFCSYACYWASGGPAKNAPNYQRKQVRGEVPGGRKQVYLGRDAEGERRIVSRSHYVWDQENPDDLVMPGEHIHHLDGDKSNDAVENLQKMQASEHLSYHARQITSEERSRRMQVYHDANPGIQCKG